MSPEEIAVKIEGHEHEIKSLKHRMELQEEESKSIRELAISLEKIALSTEHIMQEQKKQGERLEKLEKEPVEIHNKIKMSVITAVISAIVGSAIGAVLVLL